MNERAGREREEAAEGSVGAGMVAEAWFAVQRFALKRGRVSSPPFVILVFCMLLFGSAALVAAIRGGPLWNAHRWLLLGAGILVVGDAVYLFLNGVRGRKQSGL